MLSVSGYRGIEVKNYDNEHQKRTDEELADYRVVTPGQLVVNTMWLNFRGIGVSELEGYVSPAYRSYDIKDEIVGRYLHHLMRSDLYVFGYCIYLQGIRPNSLQMKTIDFEAFPIVLPLVDEQRKIVEYIDEKTTRIDQIVKAINEQVKLLNELRKTLIDDVVTGKVRITETEKAAS
jgi:type I restriction enzyme S subunit